VKSIRELPVLSKCIYCDDREGLSLDFEDRIGNYAYVCCLFCGAQGPSCLNKDQDLALEGATHKWNIWTAFLNIGVSMY
jgi:hypothetical protein